MVKIRRIKVSDWDNLKELLVELVNETPPVALELEPLIQKGDQWIAQFPKGRLGYFVIAEVQEKIVGFCYLAIPHFYKPVAYIGIAVGKKYRSNDLGSTLFYEVATWAAQEHLQYIIADIWHQNLKSLKFFESLGFIEKNRFKDKFKGIEEEKIRLVKHV